jgi:hypothetical protein
MLNFGEALARQAARSDRAWLDLLVLLHQGKRTEKKERFAASSMGKEKKVTTSKDDAKKLRQEESYKAINSLTASLYPFISITGNLYSNLSASTKALLNTNPF